jgi:hypothetical protein
MIFAGETHPQVQHIYQERIIQESCLKPVTQNGLMLMFIGRATLA